MGGRVRLRHNSSSILVQVWRLRTSLFFFDCAIGARSNATLRPIPGARVAAGRFPTGEEPTSLTDEGEAVDVVTEGDARDACGAVVAPP